MADQFLSSAFVQIKPDVRGFRTEVEKAVRKALAGTEKSGALTAKVKIVPDIRGFLTALNTQLRAIEGKARTFKVPVTPVVGKTAAATAGGTDKARESTSSLSKTQEGAVTTTTLLSDAFRLNALAAQQMSDAFTRSSVQLKASEAVRVELAGTTLALKTVEEGLIAAIKSGDPARVRELESTRASLLGIRQEAEGKIQAAANEKVLADIRTKSAAAQEKANIALTRTLSVQGKATAFAEAERSVKTQLAVVEGALATAREVNNTELAKALVTEQASLVTLRNKLALESEAFGILAAEAAASQALATARAQLATVIQTEVTGLTELATLKEIDREVTKALTAEERAFAAAEEAGVAAIELQNTALGEQVAAFRALIAEEQKAIATDAQRASSTKTGLRGARQTGAGLLGVRGATLAASDAFLAGAVAVAVFAKAVQSAAGLETELNVFQATANATADEMERVGQTALDLGADITLPSVNATDAAQAFTSLAKAGLNVEDSVDGARGVLQLATAAQIDNAEATELTASALNAFGLEGIEAVHVADLLTGAANAAQGSISEMGIALQQSSAVARQAGLSLEDTVAFITLLAKNGIRGSDAGTSLRTALLRLIAPTEQANQLLHRFGIEVLDASGNIRPEAFAELATTLDRLGATERNQVLRKIFGQDAIRAAVIFGREGVSGLNAIRDATNQAGLAAKLATARTKGFAGQMEALKNSISTVGITLGKVTIGPLSQFVDGLNEAVTLVNDLVTAVKDLPNSGGSGGKGGFLSRIFGDFGDNALFNSFGENIRELRAAGELARKSPGQLIADPTRSELPTGRIKRLNNEILETVSSAQLLGRELADAKTADDVVDQLKQMKQSLIGDSEAAETARAKIAEIETLLVGLGRKPTAVEIAVFFDQHNVESGLDRIERVATGALSNLKLAFASGVAESILAKTKVTGENAADLFNEAFKGILTPEEFGKILEKYFSAIPSTIDKMNPSGEGNFLPDGPAEGISGKTIINRIAGFDRQKLHAEVTGTAADVVAVLRAEQTFLEQQLSRALVRKNPQLRAKIETALGGVQDELESIAEESKSTAQEKADKIKQDREDAAKIVTDAFSGNEQKLLNKETLAAQTEGLKDDLVADNKLLALYRKQKAAALKKLKNTEELAAFLKEVNQKIFSVQQEIKKDKQNIIQKANQDRRDQADRAIRGIELDIELAEITENTKLEIALRKKLIHALQEQIKHEKGNTNKIKELRNEIARQRKEIEDATGTIKDRNGAFQKMSFAFLQTQSGFAANLLGNLIPSSATGGLVGGSATGGGAGLGGASTLTSAISALGGVDPATGRPLGESGRLDPRAATNAAAAASGKGPTRGGQATEIQILKDIRRLLNSIYRGTGHPEAQYRRVEGPKRMDGLGGV